MKIMSKLLKEYYLYIRSIIDFNLFIFEKIADYINVKKMIPFEVISDLYWFISESEAYFFSSNVGISELSFLKIGASFSQTT